MTGVIEVDLPEAPTNSKIVIRTDSFAQLNSEFFKKSHKFVFSQIDLAPREHDLIGLLLSRIHNEHWGEVLRGNEKMSPDYTFSNEVLSSWLNVKSKDLYSCLKNPVSSLSNKRIGIIDDVSKKLRFTPLFKDFHYEKGVLSISPNDRLSAEWLSLSGGHAQVYHSPFRALKRGYSKSLYTLFSRFKDVGKGKLQRQSLNDLHSLFGLLDEKGKHKTKSYAKTKIFMQNCIRESIKEINEIESRITFFTCPKTKNYGFSLVKQGTSIIALDFLFVWDQQVLETNNELLDRLEERPEYTDPITVYLTVRDFEIETGNPRNPTTEELLMMMAQPVALLANGYVLDADFMLKYSFAMAEASREKKE